MLFNSLEFIIFLPIVFLLYWFVFRQRKLQNLFIVIASYVFYGWWDWRFLFLIAITSACSFISGLAIEHLDGRRKSQKVVSISNIILNLLILGVFKYYNFFTDSLGSILGNFGWELDFVTLNIILPVGISFYTFQALSYTIDVYCNRIKATHDPVEFFAYISFFPQLVAGPIERATNLLPQFTKDRTFDYSKAVDGCRQMLWGFFKKIVVADSCADVVNTNWDSYDTLPGISLCLLGFYFTIQIYCDFSGYSDIAIGCARLFGFNLMRNFDIPYFSRSIPEFWRRWHISLTTWLRDYIYFPLGGSRCNKAKTIRNIFIVWGISGLWHGANWTFVCWGLFHAGLLAIYNLFGINTRHVYAVTHGKTMSCIREASQVILTFILAVIGWIIFRAESMSQAIGYFYSMLKNPFINSSMKYSRMAFCLAVILLLIEWLQKDKQHALQFGSNKLFQHKFIRWTIYYILLILIILNTGSSQTFIYFQF